MGTRNLTCVVLNGEYRIAQYGQWDGYPSGQGATALEFLHSTSLVKFIERVKACRYATNEEIEQAYKAAGADGSGFVSGAIVEKFQQHFPLINRDHGAEILALVRDSTGEVVLNNQLSFASDSLFCEYAYVIDLDKMTFEVYHGFNKEPHTGERFSDLPRPERPGGGVNEYHAVKHWVTFQIAALPTRAEFVKLADKTGEEEAA